ncbi:TPA: hypothetical protein ACOECQ_000797 [Stenotrophomonas maltophilia]
MTRPFPIGSRVRVVQLCSNGADNGLSVGDTGTVIGYSRVPCVKFDTFTPEPGDENTCFGGAHAMYSWQLELAPAGSSAPCRQSPEPGALHWIGEPARRPFQIGDRIRVTAKEMPSGYDNGDEGIITSRDSDGDLRVKFPHLDRSVLVFAREASHAEAAAGIRAGILFRWASGWIGAHWSDYNRRLCVNVLPFVTLWITLPGGKVPA